MERTEYGHGGLTADGRPYRALDRSDVFRVLRDCAEEARDLAYDNADDALVDVRIFGRAGGEWYIATGDVSYDQVHGDWCIAEIIGPDDTEQELWDLARDMLNEAISAQAEIEELS